MPSASDCRQLRRRSHASWPRSRRYSIVTVSGFSGTSTIGLFWAPLIERSCEGFPSLALSPVWDTDQHPQELSDSDSVARLFRDDDLDHSLEGFPGPQVRSEAVVASAVFPVRQPLSSVCVVTASGEPCPPCQP